MQRNSASLGNRPGGRMDIDPRGNENKGRPARAAPSPKGLALPNSRAIPAPGWSRETTPRRSL